MTTSRAAMIACGACLFVSGYFVSTSVRRSQTQRALRDAVAAVEDEIRRTPSEPRLFRALAVYCAEQRDFPRAVSAALHATALRPHEIESWIDLAGYQTKAGQTAEAQATLTHALAIASNMCPDKIQIVQFAFEVIARGGH